MSGQRRAQLPGADELFGSVSGPETSERRASNEARPAVPDGVDADVLADLVGRAADEYGPAPDPGPTAPGTAPVVGSLLAWLAGSLDANHVVEIGGDSGTLGVWLLRGMAPGGVLTSITADEQVHALGRTAFDRNGMTDRVRAILGAPGEVLPRLSDASYDLVVWADALARPRDAREHATRLLRVGGVLVVVDLATMTVNDVRERRSLVRDLIEDDRWNVTILPVGGGIALALRT